MHDADNEIVNSQANMTKANQYSLWHEVYETTGYDARNATYKNGTFIAEDGTDLLALFKEKSKNGAGYELYSKRWLQYAKNGWKKENDLVLKIGFDSSGLYDIASLQKATEHQRHSQGKAMFPLTANIGLTLEQIRPTP